MSTVVLSTRKDAAYPAGQVDRITAPYGAKVPLSFKSSKYQGYTPTSHSAITWTLIIKATKDAADSAALINVTNADLTLGTSPFAVGYTLDTTATGFAELGLYYGELWANDTTYGYNPVALFELALTNSTLTTFSQPHVILQLRAHRRGEQRHPRPRGRHRSPRSQDMGRPRDRRRRRRHLGRLRDRRRQPNHLERTRILA